MSVSDPDRAEHRSPHPNLVEAARLWGVQTEYDAGGTTVRAPDEAVLATLRELDAPVRTVEQLPEAIRAGQAEQWAFPVEPVAVCWDHDPRAGQRELAPDPGASTHQVTVRLLASELRAGVRCELTREDGSTWEWVVGPGDVEGARTLRVGGHDRVVGTIHLPHDLPHGYHDLTLHAGDRTATTRVIRAPRRAWTPEQEYEPPPRDWGLFAPTYALRSARTPGLADLTDLELLQAWTAKKGGAIVGTLPLLPIFLGKPFDPSPYAPVSRLYWNELYLDPKRVPGFERAHGASSMLGSAEYRSQSASLRAAATVDYRAAFAHRRRLIEALVADLAPPDKPLPSDLREHVAARPELREYAAFRALGEREGTGWRQWPPSLRSASAAQSETHHDQGALQYHLFAQWATDRQLREQARRPQHPGDAGSGAPLAELYMDLPLGTHPDGFDVWRWPELFGDAAAGAPPDLFYAGGQNWGFPPLHPRRSRAEGHSYWTASLRHLMRTAAMLRLDHVMSLRRLYWIPRGLPATHGAYVRYPEDELYAVLCLESHRHRTEVVGEDLGTVPEEMRATMEQHGLRRMFVVPFELDTETGTLPAPPAAAVASVGTHDLPPFRAFLEGLDLAERPEPERAARRRWTGVLATALDVGSVDPASLLRATLGRLSVSAARLVLVSLEDLLLETEPQNRPGTSGPLNWSHKARHTIEEADEIAGVQATLATVDAARRSPERGTAGELPAEKVSAAARAVTEPMDGDESRVQR